MNDPRFTPGKAYFGLVRDGDLFPLLEQEYFSLGKETLVSIVQEPETNRDFDPSFVSTRTFGPWSGELWKHRDQIGFRFFSGEQVAETRIRVSVYGDIDQYSAEDLEQFVASLRFFQDAMVQ